MNRISDKKKCMASLAVFRDLYNQKKDIYFVIAEFEKLAVAEKALSSFNLQQMVNIIKHDYGLDLPSAVVKRALGRLKFLDKSNDNYTVNKDIEFNADEIRKNTDAEDNKNQKILESLYTFVESKSGKILSAHEKSELSNNFCSFIVDDSNPSQYGEYISQFIIKNTNDNEFVEQLNQIRQGVVIYVGLNYNADFHNIDKLDTPLYIYLDTEIMFHMFGLNGELYKNLFDEFYDLVQEINNKARKQIIRLRYFAENRDEIESYFRAAERIVRKEEQLNPSKQAMRNIVNGCIDASQVVEKKTVFFKALAEKDIILDSQNNYYDKEVNWEFLIDSKPFYENIDDDTTEKDIDRKVKLLNYISIKRGYKNTTIFRTVGHILLSANKVTFNISRKVKEENSIPLATNLSFLTNRFWLTLNKGLSGLSTLRSINIISKAQIALSSRINDNVGRLYFQFIEEDKQGKFDFEQKKATLAELHISTVSPDDLTADNTDAYTDVLGVNDINAFIAEKELVDLKIKKEREGFLNEMENIKGKVESLQRKHEIESSQQEASLIKAAKEILGHRNKQEQEFFEDTNKLYDEELKVYVKDCNKKDRKTNYKVAGLYSALVVILFVSNILFDKNSSNTLSKIAGWIISFIIFAAPFIRPITEHNKISNSFLYIFRSSYRKKLEVQHEEKFRASNPVPVLRLTTLEEIIQELKSNSLRT